MRPGPFEAEREPTAGVGEKDIAAPQGYPLAAVADPGFAPQMHAGDVEMPACVRYLGASVRGAESLAGYGRHGQPRDRPSPNFPAKGMVSGHLDPHRVDLPGDQISPEVQPLTLRHGVGPDRIHVSPLVESAVAHKASGTRGNALPRPRRDPPDLSPEDRFG